MPLKMNGASRSGRINEANPLIAQNQEAPLPVHSTRPAAGPPNPLFGHPVGPCARPLVGVYAAGHHRALYLFDNLQPVTFATDPLRFGSEPPALLRLHGLPQATVETSVADTLEPDPRAGGRGPVIGRAG